MKLPSFRRIYEQDYPPDSQPLIKQLSVTLNYGFQALYDVLNGKLTFSDNIASTVKQITVQVDATGNPTANTVIQKNTTDKILGLMVVNAQNQTNSNVYPTGGIFISYTETTNSLTINNITGLPPNNTFLLQIVTIR